MSQKKQTSKDLQKVEAPQVENINPETITATEPAIVEAQTITEPQTEPVEEATPAEFQKLDLFPVLTEGAKFEINGYKVTITKKEYLKDEKFPYTAWNATVIAPDGTTKDFQKVRNTAIRNYCKAVSGITHNGGSQTITKVLTDEEIATECTRRTAQIKGLLDRANELYTKYAGAQLINPDEIFNATHRDAILGQLKEENNARKESAEKAKAANAERQARKQTRDLTAEISKLIAAGDFQKAAELMQQKANATKATEETETTTAE